MLIGSSTPCLITAVLQASHTGGIRVEVRGHRGEHGFICIYLYIPVLGVREGSMGLPVYTCIYLC